MRQYTSMYGTTYTFSYTGDPEGPIRVKAGYVIELWGAQGGGAQNLKRWDFPTDPRYTKDDPMTESDAVSTVGYGGGGAYVCGTINTAADIYVVVGGAGKSEAVGTAQGGYNGGGSTRGSGIGEGAGGGGGATDIRLCINPNDIRDTQSLCSRIMVASGGGGGGEDGEEGAPGGTFNGIYGSGASMCPTQTGQYFGYSPDSLGDGGGHGGGYYCSWASNNSPGSDNQGGSSGSSFISGLSGCNAVQSQTSISPTGQPNHYSGVTFSDAVMTQGAFRNSGNWEGNPGDGFAMIHTAKENKELFHYLYTEHCKRK